MRHLRLLGGAIATLAVVTACHISTANDAPSSGPLYTITPDLHDSASFNAGTAVLVRVHVTHQGAGIGGATVGWAVAAGHGLVSADTSTADTLGVATIVWTLGDTAATNALVIRSGDAVDTLHVIGTVGSPSYLTAVSADSMNAPVGTAVSLQVRVNDRPGNAVAGATVNWSATGGTWTGQSVVSAASGVASVTFTAQQPGTYFVTANLPERSSIVFQVVVP